ncbi:MAG: phosphotransferase family protein [Chloroflexota bacterium]|nr:MAG: phosphotransferase family protein [Chloroflexota bacterium]
MTESIDQVIRRVPHWADAANLTYSPLGGGITNRNYKVEVGGESYVLRIAGVNTDLLGIDRDAEFEASSMAGELGIAPEVFYFIRPEGYLVSRFIDGSPLPPEEVKQPENLKTIVEMLKQFHASPTIPGTFWVPQIVKDYSAIATSHQIEFPHHFDWLLECLADAVDAFNADPLPHCPCHNDLLNENFLVENQRIFILDWEYAGMGDRYFDLANLSVNHEFNDDQDDLLLQDYFGEVNDKNWARLKVMRVISDYRESMWGLVQMGISELDFDFREYADKHFDRLTGNLEDPNWGKWLEIIKS